MAMLIKQANEILYKSSDQNKQVSKPKQDIENQNIKVRIKSGKVLQFIMKDCEELLFSDKGSILISDSKEYYNEPALIGDVRISIL